MSSSPSSSTSAHEQELELDEYGLELDSLDADSLFQALTNVEKAIPELLQAVKPILSHLTSSSSSDGRDEENSGILARQNVEKYMGLLDKIQFVLRQTVYYLRETRTSPNTLRPPTIDSIPTPFASTLPSSNGGGTGGREVELGLYASRIEATALREFKEALKTLLNTDGSGGTDPPNVDAVPA